MMKPIELRRSIRKYLAKPVDDDTIKNLVESARLAPSGNNTQPWHFIVIRDEAIKQKIVTASYNQKWMLTAPVFIACIADIRSRIASDTKIDIDEESPQHELKQIIRDTAIAIEHIVLEATNEGLGTCWVARFAQKDIRPILGLSNDKYVVSIITVGYPDENPQPKKRKELREILHHEKW